MFCCVGSAVPARYPALNEIALSKALALLRRQGEKLMPRAASSAAKGTCNAMYYRGCLSSQRLLPG